MKTSMAWNTATAQKLSVQLTVFGSNTSRVASSMVHFKSMFISSALAAVLHVPFGEHDEKAVRWSYSYQTDVDHFPTASPEVSHKSYSTAICLYI